MTDQGMMLPFNSDLREAARLLGFTTCGDEHHVEQAGGSLNFTLALLATISELAVYHASQIPPTVERTQMVEDMQHNLHVGLGIQECDDEHHAGIRSPDSCCHLNVS